MIQHTILLLLLLQTPAVPSAERLAQIGEDAAAMARKKIAELNAENNGAAARAMAAAKKSASAESQGEQKAAEQTEDEIWTLEEIDEDIQLQEMAASTPNDEFYMNMEGRGKRMPLLLGEEPPEDPAEYAVAVAEVMTRPAEELFSYAAYKGASPRENVGNNIRLGGSEVRIATLDIQENATEVGKYYAREFASRSIYPLIQQLADNVVYFSFRGEDGFQRMITLVAQTDNHTVVLASVSDARKVYNGLLGLNDEMPKVKEWTDWKEPEYEGIPLVMEQTEGSGHQISRTISVRAESADKIMEQYVRDLTMSGWTVSSEEGFQRNMKVFEKKDEGKRCLLTITPGRREGTFDCQTLCTDFGYGH